MSNLTDAAGGQAKIWRHFQNEAPAVFEDSHARHDFLAKRMLRRGARAAKGSPPCVLNIGAGDGYLERRLQQLGCRVSSLDPDEGVMGRLRASGIDAHTGSIEKLPFADGCFDFVVASEVLEHLSERQRGDGIGQIARVLQEGGWFLGTVPYRERLEQGATVCPDCERVFHRWGHQASFDRAAVARMMPKELQLREARPTAFTPLRGRGASGFVKAVGRRVLARMGEPVAQPTLYFVAERT